MKIYIKAAVSSLLDEDADTLQELAENPNTPPEVLAELANSDNAWVLHTLLRNPNTPSYILDNAVDSLIPGASTLEINYLSARDTMSSLGVVAANPSVSDSTLIKLAKFVMDHFNSEPWRLYEPLLENPNTPAEALSILINEKTHNARNVTDNVITHPNVTLDVLKKLLIVDDGYCSYLETIAETHHLPDEFLWEFARNGCNEDRRDIAGLKYTPSEILEYLIEHYPNTDFGYIRGDALTNPNLSADAMYKFSRRSKNLPYILRNPNCPSDILAKAANKLIAAEDFWNLEYIATNPNTDVDTMYKIFNIKSGSARKRLAQNPNIPTELAKQLALSDDWTKEQIAKNSGVDPEVLATLVKSKIDVRKALARNPNTPPKTLMKLAKDRSHDVVRTVTENPNLPEEVFVYLLDTHGSWWALEKQLKRFPQYKDQFEQGRRW